RDVHAGHLADGHRDVRADELLEALQRHPNGVVPGQQVVERVRTGLVGHGHALEARLRARHGDGRPGNGRARRITDVADKTAVQHLGRCRRCHGEQREGHAQDPQAPDHGAFLRTFHRLPPKQPIDRYSASDARSTRPLLYMSRTWPTEIIGKSPEGAGEIRLLGFRADAQPNEMDERAAMKTLSLSATFASCATLSSWNACG